MNEIVTESNQFFNPDHYDTHVVGFVEELVMSTETAYGWKMLGTRRLPGLPDRPIGSPGTIMITITEDQTLQSGHKTVRVRASKKHPILCQATIQPICGKFKKQI
jgi:hypothetical protein